MARSINETAIASVLCGCGLLIGGVWAAQHFETPGTATADTAVAHLNPGLPSGIAKPGEGQFTDPSRLHEIDSFAAVATGTMGACCDPTPSCSCVANQTVAQCAALGGTHQGNKTICANDLCGCLVRGCCSPAGVCLGDTSRTCCQTGLEADGMTSCAPPFDVGGNTWHLESACGGAGGLPPPICNVYHVNHCSWDNGLPLDDGGASRAHTHSGGTGQEPRYDFNTADDFVLHGPDSTLCEIDLVTWYMRARPADTTGPIFTPPDPLNDFIAVNVTVFGNYVAASTGLDSPAGHGNVPLDASELNPKVADAPGGIAYARSFLVTGNAVSFTLLPGFCDPPPAVGLETAAVYRVDITVEPPILLNKNTPYWLDVQGVFPFNDGLRETLQSWWMPSDHNTGLRGMTQRTGNPDYVVGGLPAWVPNNMDLVPLGNPPQRGNQGAVAPCAELPAFTHLDFAFQLNGVKDAPSAPNDLCADAAPAYDGVTAFDSTGASTDGLDPVSCGTIEQDLWFGYTATCTGVLTVSTCGSAFESIVAVYDADSCPEETQRSRGRSVEHQSEPQAAGRSYVSEPRNSQYAQEPVASSPGSDFHASLGLELACNDNNDACAPNSDDAQAHLVVAQGAEYLIRVGSSGGSAARGVGGYGMLTLDCRATCGVPTAGDCCAAHGPAVGCLNDNCCVSVCAAPGYEYCCNDLVTGWDAGCASVAAQLPACACPCKFTCPGGAQFETEACGQRTNGGCDYVGIPQTFHVLGALTPGTPSTMCGTLEGPDTDWFSFHVPATPSGVATATVVVNGSAPMAARLLGREDVLINTSSGETFCIDKQCSGGASLPCTQNADCPVGQSCATLGATLLLFDEIATGSCQPTDGVGASCMPLVTCVPAPGDYAIVTYAAETYAACQVGDRMYSGVSCGPQDDYSFTLTIADNCVDGACCTCQGGCIDAKSNPPGVNEVECHAQRGTFAGENTACAVLPPNFLCSDYAHGCALALPIECGSVTQVDLTTANRPPDEPYPCVTPTANRNDSAWYQFVATSESVRVRTCGSVNPGRDSVLAVYSGSCCDLGDPLTGIDCSDDDCGFTGDLSHLCVVGLIPGETYYIQISNFNEPINGIYALELDCPCVGSCCNGTLAVCTDDVPLEDCQPPLLFDSARSCSETPLPCGFGACCAPDGTCSEVDTSACPSGSNHVPGVSCDYDYSVGAPVTLCNPHNSCDHSTGEPNSTSFTVFGYRSQYVPDTGFYREIADDFTLRGDGDNPCLVSLIQYVTFHTGHDLGNGCMNGGGPNCTDGPDDYEGLVVTISEDVGGGQGPTCVPTQPIDPGSDGDYHEGPGCVFSRTFGPMHIGPPPVGGHWWEGYMFLNSSQYANLLSIHFDPPVQLEKNRMYWLALSHQRPFIGGYNVIWFATIYFDGTFSQSFDAQGAGAFTPLSGTPNDMVSV